MAVTERDGDTTTETARPGFGRRFEVDSAGHLYDPGFRAHLKRTRRMDADELASSEALVALVTCGKVLQQRFEELLQHVGLSHQQFRLLMWVNSCGGPGCQLHEIADWLRVTPRNVTGLVDGLASEGLVERVADPGDRRAVIARLTPLGEARAAAAKREYARATNSVMAVLNNEEKSRLRDSVLKVLRALDSGELKRSRTDG